MLDKIMNICLLLASVFVVFLGVILVFAGLYEGSLLAGILLGVPVSLCGISLFCLELKELLEG